MSLTKGCNFYSNFISESSNYLCLTIIGQFLVFFAIIALNRWLFNFLQPVYDLFGNLIYSKQCLLGLYIKSS